MAKKKIIAIGATAAAVTLIAGVGIAAWAFGAGSAESGTTDIPGHITPTGSAEWGSIAVADGHDYSLVFDQNKIFIGDNVEIYTEQSDPNYNCVKWQDAWSDAEWTGAPIQFTWTLDEGNLASTAIGAGDVEYYVTLTLSEDLTDYLQLKTEGGATSGGGLKYKLDTANCQVTKAADSKTATISVNLGGYIEWAANAKPENETALQTFALDLTTADYVVQIAIEAVQKAAQA